ncbi:hypothetical protein KAJ27_09950 [bacterium]|nr:hypothetical protein [bacterium]
MFTESIQKKSAKIEEIKKLHNLNPAGLDDPIAALTKWNPLTEDGNRTQNYELRRKQSSKMIYSPTIDSIRNYFLMILFGLIPILSFSVFNGFFGLDPILITIIGLLFIISGIFFLYNYTVPMTFDLGCGFYWKGRNDPDTATGNRVLLDDIHAFQLITKHYQGNNVSYLCYEFNLVLQNGNRINVVNHGNLQAIKNELLELSSFLNKPIWDAAEIAENQVLQK